MANFMCKRRFHLTIKEIFSKTKRMDRVISLLLDNIKDRMTERRIKMRIRDLRFPTRKTNPLFEKFRRTITLYAWEKVLEQIEFVEKLKEPYKFTSDMR